MSEPKSSDKSADLYEAPKANLGEQKNEKSWLKLARERFLLTSLVAFPVYMAIVYFYTSKQELLYGVLGSVMLAMFSGFIAIFVPVKFKIVYIAIGLFVSLAIAYYVGSYSAELMG